MHYYSVPRKDTEIIMVRFRNWAREINWLAVIAVTLAVLSLAVSVVGFIFTGQWWLLLFGLASTSYILAGLARE